MFIGIPPQLRHALPEALLQKESQIATKWRLRRKTGLIEYMDLHVDANMHDESTGKRGNGESRLPASHDEKIYDACA